LIRLLQTPQGEVLIRPSQPGDVKAYRGLRLEALKGHPTAFGSDYEESLQHPEEYWQEKLKINQDREILFFAEMEGRLVGMTGIYRASGKKQAHSATVWGVYVAPELRGLHIAEELIRACLDWGREHGVVIARLGVAADNQAAIRCYERCGFKIYGLEKKSGFYEGKYLDEYLMDCSLE
jgi:RimJ/RimL family protein N-acetyltransferase